MRISDWSSDVCSSDLIHVDRQHEPVSPYEYGMFIEPIGSLVARTLWAEMLDDRKFYFPVVDAAHDPELPTGVEGRPAMPLRTWRPIGDAAAVTMAAGQERTGTRLNSRHQCPTRMP